MVWLHCETQPTTGFVMVLYLTYTCTPLGVSTESAAISCKLSTISHGNSLRPNTAIDACKAAASMEKEHENVQNDHHRRRQTHYSRYLMYTAQPEYVFGDMVLNIRCETCLSASLLCIFGSSRVADVLTHPPRVDLLPSCVREQSCFRAGSCRTKS